MIYTQQKTFFLIRHGESTWNEAKRRFYLHRLLLYRDHALTREGVQQAADLNARWKQNDNCKITDRGTGSTFDANPVVATDNKDFVKDRHEEYTQMFMGSNKVYCSPSTRAIETAVVSLEGHAALVNNEITLDSTLREIKMAGCFDATGKKCGDDILPRVNRKLTAVLGQQQADVLINSAKGYDVNNADRKWWSPMLSGTDKEEDTQDRVREFLSFVRQCDAQTPIIVGHSQFFKAFYSKRISEVLSHNRPEMSANMQKYRLGNATVLAVTVSFVDSATGATEAEIVDADILFDGSFQH